MSMYDNMAQAIGNPTRVCCRECGRTISVRTTAALEHGWPKCCEYTMTIDHPSTWGDDVPGKARALRRREATK